MLKKLINTVDSTENGSNFFWIGINMHCFKIISLYKFKSTLLWPGGYIC